jgi:hypothetical protein
LKLCEKLDLMKSMSIKQDYDDELIKELFATIYFHKDDARSMNSMSGVIYSRTL